MKKKALSILFLFCVTLLFACAATSAFSQECGPIHCHGKKVITNPPCYQLLFFRHDGRVWIVLPKATNMVEIHSSTANSQGWVRAYNCWRQPLAVDNFFNGSAAVSTVVPRACTERDRLVVTLHDQDSVGIFTPPNAAYIEIINATNGFDGIVNVFDRNKRVITRQTGVDIEIVDYQ